MRINTEDEILKNRVKAWLEEQGWPMEVVMQWLVEPHYSRVKQQYEAEKSTQEMLFGETTIPHGKRH